MKLGLRTAIPFISEKTTSKPALNQNMMVELFQIIATKKISKHNSKSTNREKQTILLFAKAVLKRELKNGL